MLRVDGRFGYLQHAISYAEGVRFPQFTWEDARRLLDSGIIEVTGWMGEEKCIGRSFPYKYKVLKGVFCLYPVMVWLPCWESRSPFYPFYMVTIGSDKFYISSLNGIVYRNLHPFGPAGRQYPGGL